MIFISHVMLTKHYCWYEQNQAVFFLSAFYWRDTQVHFVSIENTLLHTGFSLTLYLNIVAHVCMTPEKSITYISILTTDLFFGRKIKCMLQKKVIVEECFNENNNTRAHEEENYFWKGTTLCVVIFFKKSLSLKCVFCRIRLLCKKNVLKVSHREIPKKKKKLAWLFIFVSRVCTFVYFIHTLLCFVCKNPIWGGVFFLYLLY